MSLRRTRKPEDQAYKKKVGRVLYIDWAKAYIPQRCNMVGVKAAQQKHWEQKKENPYEKTVGRPRAYEDWRDFLRGCDSYFESCQGVLFGRNGLPLIGSDGLPVIGQVRAYSYPGLCLHLGILKSAFERYMRNSRAGVIPPEFYFIGREAMLRIEDFYAQQLTTRDGARGAQFALQCGFRWSNEKEKSEIRAIEAKIQLEREQFQLKKQEIEAKLKLLGKVDTDENWEIKIVRASEVEA